MILACETCQEQVGWLVGAVDRFMCFSCMSEQAFGSGKDGSPGAGVPVAKTSIPAGSQAPVPANPVVAASAPSQSPPATTGPISDVVPGSVVWTAKDVRAALFQTTLPELLYRRLTAYAALYVPSAVFTGRGGRLVLRNSATYDDDDVDPVVRRNARTGERILPGTTVLTDKEIEEALR